MQVVGKAGDSRNNLFEHHKAGCYRLAPDIDEFCLRQDETDQPDIRPVPGSLVDKLGAACPSECTGVIQIASPKCGELNRIQIKQTIRIRIQAGGIQVRHAAEAIYLQDVDGPLCPREWRKRRESAWRPTISLIPYFYELLQLSVPPYCAAHARKLALCERRCTGSKILRAAILADREGFEPSRRFVTVYTLSRRAPSAARPPVRDAGYARRLRRGGNIAARFPRAIFIAGRFRPALRRGRAPPRRPRLCSRQSRRRPS
jgi:hypothetical protein